MLCEQNDCLHAKDNIRFAKVQLQVEVKPFLTSTQRQRSQKNYSIKLRAGRCTAQHNSLHVAPHTAIFSKREIVALHPLLEKKTQTRTFTVSMVLRKESKRRKQEKIAGIVLVTLGPKCCVLSVIKEPSYSDLKAHFTYLILVEPCRRINILNGKWGDLRKQ